MTAGALIPFVIALLLAYISAPVVDALERRKVNRTVAAMVVLIGAIIAFATIPVALLPLLAYQIGELMATLPQAITDLKTWVSMRLNLDETLVRLPDNVDWGSLLQEKATQNTEAATGLLGAALGSVGRGIGSLVAFVTTLLIAPLITFYLLRDWHHLISDVKGLIPPSQRSMLTNVASTCDGILGEFLRGQLTVMAIMAGIYSTLLLLTGLDFAVAIGTISGLLAFIPYVGFVVGALLATIAGAIQFESWETLLWVWLAMLSGTLVESFVLTPKIVGERIGLHPAVVLLALSIMGALLGFVGLLLALPTASIFLALTRHAKQVYLNSDLFNDQ